jgi:hypothetical protein
MYIYEHPPYIETHYHVALSLLDGANLFHSLSPPGKLISNCVLFTRACIAMKLSSDEEMRVSLSTVKGC